jgi:Protein of unknown function (DUF664)
MESRPGVPDDWLGVRAPERETLTGTLDWYRGVVIGKLDGLSREQAVTKLGPSGLHLIEETARHAGRLDLMREQVDGRTGD